MSEMEITWAHLAAVVFFMAFIGQGFFLIGRMWQRQNGQKEISDRHEARMEVLFSKIDEIWQYIRNGRKRGGG